MDTIHQRELRKTNRNREIRLTPPLSEAVQAARQDELVRRIAQVRAEIARADTKSGLIVAGTTTLVALGATAMGSVQDPLPMALGWSAIATATAAIGMCGLVVMPGRGLGPQAEVVPKTLTAIAEARHEEHQQIGQIAQRKFMRLRYAVAGIAAATVLAVAAGITAATLTA